MNKKMIYRFFSSVATLMLLGSAGCLPILDLFIEFDPEDEAAAGSASESQPVTTLSATQMSIEASESPIDLTDIIYVAEGGGGGPAYCDDPFSEIQPGEPGLVFLDKPGGPYGGHDMGYLCVLNFPQGEVRIDLNYPSGQLANSTTTEVVQSEYFDITFGGVPLWLPANLPDAVWVAEATQGNISAELSFTPQEPTVSVVPDTYTIVLDPFQERSFRAEYRSGQQVVLKGIHLPPGEELFIGLYHGASFNYLDPDGKLREDGDALLRVDGRSVRIDEDGQFIAGVTIDDSYPDGGYIVMYGDEPPGEGLIYYKLWNLPGFRVRDAPSEWRPCPGTYLTRLHLGDRASVATDPPLANNVRERPSLSGKLVGKIQPGDGMVVMAGPRCADGMVWWSVQSDDGEVSGWTSEGDENGYFLVPER